MLHIDGGQKSGSGTIVRYAIGLAALLGEELELTNIRAKRDKPGLRLQHLAAVKALAQLCGGQVEGAKVGTSSIVFRPKTPVSGGNFQWDIGSAGSTTMLAFSVLTAACFAESPLTCRISGGLFQDFAPSLYHMQHVLLPVLRRMGVQAELEMVRPGYVPKGGGIIELKVKPVKGKLVALQVPEQGKIVRIEGIAISSHLQERKVSDRMADECRQVLAESGYDASIRTVYDNTALQAGAALAVVAQTDTGCIIGADGAGAPRRTSEYIGQSVAERLVEDIAAGATVDRFIADQLVFFAALSQGTSRYRIPRVTEHVETNLWLVETILGVRTRISQDRTVEIEGVAFEKP
jgi:RNA 3'-terminal phosphate cyclase (ATP)